MIKVDKENNLKTKCPVCQCELENADKECPCCGFK